ncbi:hypothetical protein LOTGIDRAFT_162622 [Lottia gigantea]|uniref:Uncharacterized protein n=1 Tax=Lottia gigantea TaxID=225164 RepID=V4BT82_LOTGI|nr:hypothetical protein LOTGIDRAFT_162622 [Lottia gigantea]ESO92319.1 hypothetical protein LOTGIDRAFT_162622 [Lottia gigantea]
MEMEKIAQGSGVADILGAVKEFGNRFSEETKKTVKEGLSNLIDKIHTGGMKIYTTTPEQSYYQFLKALEYIPKKDVQDIFKYYEDNDEIEIKDILDPYIKEKNPSFNPMDLKVFLRKILQQLGLTENLQTLFQPILKSQEDIKKRLAPRIEPHKDPPKPIEYGGFIIRTLGDIKLYFSNPNPDLPKSITPIVDNEGLLFNGFRIRFSANSPIFKIDTKDFIFTLTEGLIDLINGGDVDIADYKDLVEYSEFLHMIRKTGPETRRLKEVDHYIKAINQDDEYAEDNPITQQIDELEEEIARENSGQGITFLSDNNEELLNRLEIILAAMKDGHRSDRQYNEVNCILRRFLEKGIIDKKKKKVLNVIDKIIQ